MEENKKARDIFEEKFIKNIIENKQRIVVSLNIKL